MKKRYLNIVVFALFVSMLWGCSDWTKPEAEDFLKCREMIITRI